MNELKPSFFVGGIIGSIYSFLFGELNDAFLWLFCMMVVDYVTGIMQAVHNRKLSSKIGFKGIIKKVIIITIVVLSHGLSEIIHLTEIETAVIFAFALNEMCSILENIERSGFGDIIPKPIRRILEIAGEKEEKMIDKLKD
jgi:toxin secretion/phage lysis holin